MLDTEFTPLNIAKYGVQFIIATGVGERMENLLVDYTQFEKGDKIVKFSGVVVGWGVSRALKPHTDKIVDKAAGFVAQKRADRAAKKNPVTV
jgi:hypothetical protein